MKILIEIWGNFEKWKEVNYYYGNENIKDSKTTFPLLFQCINPSSVFVIVSDTLIDNYDEEYENYSHIIDQVTIETKSFIDDINKKFNTNLNDYNIIVAPGIGRFEKIEVKGNPHNFYAFIYTKLSCFITEHLEEIFSNEEIEVYLDITHGINYMTMMSYRAVKDILSILAYYYNIKFIVLNSDPSVGTQSKDLKINEIEKIIIQPGFQVYNYKDRVKILIPSKILEDNKKTEIAQFISDNIASFKNEFINQIFYLASSIFNWVPIFIFKFFVSPEEIKKFIDKVIETFKEKIFLNKVNGATEIVHQIDIKSSFISILQTYLICFLIEKILGNNIVHEEIELSKLKKIKGDFNWNRVYKMRLEKEFSKLTKVNLDNNFKKYSDLQNDKDKNDENKNKEKLDERNFFAHCGFNYELLSIKKISDEIFLKINDDLIKDAKDLLDKNLPRGDYDGSK